MFLCGHLIPHPSYMYCRQLFKVYHQKLKFNFFSRPFLQFIGLLYAFIAHVSEFIAILPYKRLKIKNLMKKSHQVQIFIQLFLLMVPSLRYFLQCFFLVAEQLSLLFVRQNKRSQNYNTRINNLEAC